MSLNFLNSIQFEQSFLHSVGQERKFLKRVLEHIREADARRFYLEKGRRSLYDYLTKDLGYSSSSAQRRIEAARLLKEIPQISAQIEAGKINLSQICEVAKSVKQASQKVGLAQKTDLLKALECKSTSETQQIVAQSLDLTVKESDIKRVQKDHSVRVEMTLTKDQYEKFQRCRDTAAHTLLNTKSLDLADVVEFLCDQYEVSIAASAIRRVKMPAGKVRKCITRKVRSEVRQRYGVCRHQDRITKKLCGSSFLLQVDHIRPRWAGGDHEDENLTLLCANHNQSKYRAEAGLS